MCKAFQYLDQAGSYASNSLTPLKAIKAEVENQLNERIKYVRSGRDDEYYDGYDESGEQHSGLFAKFLEECGIAQRYTRISLG